MPNPNYTVPGVSGTGVVSQAQTSVSPGVRRIALLGTAGQGPDVPTEYNNVAAALVAYGAPGAPGTLPQAIQLAMTAAPNGSTPAPCIVCRTGVTRASKTIPDTGSPATLILLDGSSVAVATVSSMGTTYGGAAGSGLTVTVSAGTASGFKVVIKHTSTVLSTYDNLPTGAAFVAAVNQAILAGTERNIFATVGTSTNVAANISATPLAGGGSGSALVATVQGIGAYAGSKGNNLAVQVAAGTGQGFKVVITDTVLSTTLATYDNLLTGSDFASAARGDANIAILIGPSTLQAATAAASNLTGGLDGVSTPGNDASVASMYTLLFSGMVTAPSYVCPLWDASVVYTSTVAALAAAAASASNPVQCMAFLGGALSSSISTITTLAGTISNPKVWLYEVPGGIIQDPTINGLRAIDGFYIAATAMALKGALPVNTSLIGQTLTGFVDNVPITVGGITRSPVLADLTAGGAAGCSYALAGPDYAGLEIVDSLTTAPQTGQYGWQSQPGMQDGLHYAQTTAYKTGRNLVKRGTPGNSTMSNHISSNVYNALKALEGSAIYRVVGVTTTPDPATLGRYLPQVAVQLAPTLRAISFNFAVQVQP